MQSESAKGKLHENCQIRNYPNGQIRAHFACSSCIVWLCFFLPVPPSLHGFFHFDLKKHMWEYLVGRDDHPCFPRDFPNMRPSWPSRRVLACITYPTPLCYKVCHIRPVTLVQLVMLSITQNLCNSWLHQPSPRSSLTYFSHKLDKASLTSARSLPFLFCMCICCFLLALKCPVYLRIAHIAFDPPSWGTILPFPIIKQDPCWMW